MLKLQVWDTAGQENFNAITKMFYRAANCIFFCFDLCSRRSFENLTNWHDGVVNAVSEEDKIITFLIGTKKDRAADLQVTNGEVRRF